MLLECFQNPSMLFDRYLRIITFWNHTSHRKSVPKFGDHFFHLSITCRTPDFIVKCTVEIRVFLGFPVFQCLTRFLIDIFYFRNICSRFCCKLCCRTLEDRAELIMFPDIGFRDSKDDCSFILPKLDQPVPCQNLKCFSYRHCRHI